MRDEAHRFAITAHRQRRKKQSLKSLFDEIKGIGLIRKKKLMLHFGSIKKIQNASFGDIREVEGISKDLARNIYDFFHSQ